MVERKDGEGSGRRPIWGFCKFVEGDENTTNTFDQDNQSQGRD
jgi:hypothetical protein